MPSVAEVDLYPLVLSFLNIEFAGRLKPRLGSHLTIANITAKAGPAASGTWSRPDLALVNAWRHKYKPGALLELHGFEVKRDGGCDLTSVHETLALSATMGVGKLAMDAWQRRMIERQRPILIEELRHGRATLLDAYKLDPFLSCVHRWDRAAVEGSAKFKLRLMARVLAGQLQGRELIADEFLCFAAQIENLRREEVILATTLHRLEVKHAALPPAAQGEAVRAELYAELVPRIFSNPREVEATATALWRTGFLVLPTTYERSSCIAAGRS